MEFKQLEIKREGSWLKRQLTSSHFKKSIIYILVGAFLGIVFTYLTNGMQYSSLESKDLISNIFVGAFFGFFITNSPCARNKC